MSRRPHQKGFSLLEALVGLAIVGLAILLTMSLMGQQPKVEQRLAARLEVFRLMEMEMEILRSTGELLWFEELGVSEHGIELDLRQLVFLLKNQEEIDPVNLEALSLDELLTVQGLKMAAQSPRMWFKVSDDSPIAPRLYEVELTARFKVDGHSYQVALKSILFNKLKHKMVAALTP